MQAEMVPCQPMWTYTILMRHTGLNFSSPPTKSSWRSPLAEVISYWSKDSVCCVGVLSRNKICRDFAYVIWGPLHATWTCLNCTLCSCRAPKLQQQCVHTLFVEGLEPPAVVLTHRQFEDLPVRWNGGRPKGKALPKDTCIGLRWR